MTVGNEGGVIVSSPAKKFKEEDVEGGVSRRTWSTLKGEKAYAIKPAEAGTLCK